MACSEVGLEQYFESVEMVKARSGRVPSIAYIIDPITCWYSSSVVLRGCIA